MLRSIRSTATSMNEALVRSRGGENHGLSAPLREGRPRSLRPTGRRGGLQPPCHRGSRRGTSATWRSSRVCIGGTQLSFLPKPGPLPSRKLCESFQQLLLRERPYSQKSPDEEASERKEGPRGLGHFCLSLSCLRRYPPIEGVDEIGNPARAHCNLKTGRVLGVEEQ
jgi:hypothetical protein